MDHKPTPDTMIIKTKHIVKEGRVLHVWFCRRLEFIETTSDGERYMLWVSPCGIERYRDKQVSHLSLCKLLRGPEKALPDQAVVGLQAKAECLAAVHPRG